ncbi:MAG: aspartate carbamoyltransferase [Candidatus Eremiobacter antarcticus]|nr:aspartate carbamoyltransferase catalytic subunit [Candidatus Eremiobacteraeota bacterium]MBC5807680.1 aspartate carbamoyltransferase catalytic subunit [Candidatus Eremiobacteraeota bacterium]PZR60499.1 MAG: aspartate carbamoyltransferase [Candidatus Eremiobacter sp. RRmetagenome_bin22]
MIKTRHLLDLDDADRPFIEALIARARQFKQGIPNEGSRLRGRVVLGMFFETSTRTTTSFAVAAQRLGAAWINFRTDGSSLSKGESLEDTMHTVQAIGADAIVVRHPEAGFPQALARHFDGAILNAGDGAHAHPTQGLLDAMTLLEEFGDLTGRRLVICGDIRHSRVARSSARAAWLLGAAVTLCGPPSLLPPSEPGWGFAQLSSDFDAVLSAADALMLLRVQKERALGDDLPPYEDLAKWYGLTQARASMLAPHCIIMHPGPVNRDIEVEGQLMRNERSRIDRQVENGVYVRMAVLERTLGQASRERAA